MNGIAIRRKIDLIALGMVEEGRWLRVPNKLDVCVEDLGNYNDDDWKDLYDRADQYTMKERYDKHIAELERENQWLRDRIEVQVTGINARDKELQELRSKSR